MRVVFMGTPEFAACSLKRLLDDGFETVGVFCQPDRPKGRGNRFAACPVKELALSRGVPVYQPATLRDGTALETLTALAPDVIAVVAYGRILPDDILALPKYGCVNIHGSLLPKYRGSAPIQWSVLNGEELAGVTSMYISHDMDTGDTIYSESTPIGQYETSGQLFARLAPMGAALLSKTLRAIEDGTAPRVAQNHALATCAPPLTREQASVDWRRSAVEIVKQICGLQPWPVAETELFGTRLKLYGAEYTHTVTSEAPGTVLAADKRGIEVACGDSASLRITELQASNGKRMSAAAWLLGHPRS